MNDQWTRFLIGERRGRHRLFGWIDASGAVLISPRYPHYCAGFSEGRAGYGTRHRRYGLIDAYGEEITGAKFMSIGRFADGCAPASTSVDLSSYREGLIDRGGNWIIEPSYRQLLSFRSGCPLAAAQNEFGRWGYIDRSGRVRIDFHFAFASPFAEGLASVRLGQDCKSFYIDESGREATPAMFDMATLFSGGVATVKIGERFYILKQDFRLIELTNVASMSWFSEGRAMFEGSGEKEGQWGFLDEAGDTVIPAQWDWVDHFREDLAFVRKGDLRFFIDREGRRHLALTATGGWGFEDGLARVWVKEGRRYLSVYIDKSGRRVWSGPYFG